MLLSSAKWLFTCVLLMMMWATSILVMVNGAYVDNPVCSVCTCDAQIVYCRNNLPAPAQWKDLDAKYTEVEILVDSHKKLEKDSFKGIHKGLKYFTFYDNDIAEIEGGGFNGVTVTDRLYVTPHLC